MRVLDLLAFECRRAGRSLIGPMGLISLLLGSVFLAFVALNGIGPSQAASTRQIGLIFGAAWAALAAVYAVDRNKRSLVEDVWFALDPRWRSQLAVIYAAWIPVALVQACATMLVVVAVRPGSHLSDLLGLLEGFALAMPLGLCMTALSRLVPGFSLLSGAAFIAILIFAFALTQMLPAIGRNSLAGPVLAYVATALILFWLLTRPTGRSR